MKRFWDCLAGHRPHRFVWLSKTPIMPYPKNHRLANHINVLYRVKLGNHLITKLYTPCNLRTTQIFVQLRCCSRTSLCLLYNNTRSFEDYALGVFRAVFAWFEFHSTREAQWAQTFVAGPRSSPATPCTRWKYDQFVIATFITSKLEIFHERAINKALGSKLLQCSGAYNELSNCLIHPYIFVFLTIFWLYFIIAY